MNNKTKREYWHVERIYVCELCLASSSLKEQLMNHMKKYHEKDIEELHRFNSLEESKLCVSIKGCKNCGVLYLLQDSTCSVCSHKLQIYDLPVMEGVPD